MATKRVTFNDSDSIAEHLPQASTRQYPCISHGCPMAGTIFTAGGTGSCAYHYAANSQDWPRITQKLTDWQCVISEINECRRVHCNPATASSPAVLANLFAQAWARLEPLAPGWTEELKPQLGKGGAMDAYREWGLRLERFVGGQVVGSLQKQIGRATA